MLKFIKKRKNLVWIAVIIFFFFMAVLLYNVYYNKEVVKIGFIGNLSTKNSQLSIDARNAIQLKVNQVNEMGGVRGKKIQLIVKDDADSIEVAIQRHEEFTQEGVELVIGHMTSNMVEAVKHSQSKDLLFLSPSMGTSLLTGIDDYFIRTAPLTDNQAWTFFELVEKIAAKNILVIYDLMNAEYTENLANHIRFINEEKQLNIEYLPFDSRTTEMETLLDSINTSTEFDLFFTISQAIDTAIISQKIKLSLPDINMASVSWSMTEDLILNGGTAVQNMYFIGVNKSKNSSFEKQMFDNSFLEIYLYEPSFICYLAYDALSVMLLGIENSSTFHAMDVKNSIVSLGRIQGLIDEFTIDPYGDNDRGYLLYQLIEETFVPIFNE